MAPPLEGYKTLVKVLKTLSLSSSLSISRGNGRRFPIRLLQALKKIIHVMYLAQCPGTE